MQPLSIEQRRHNRYRVSIPGKIVIPTGQMCDIQIKDLSKGGLSFHFEQAIMMKQEIMIDFYVEYKSQKKRMLAKAKVVHNQILADNGGAKIGVKFTQISPERSHILSNVLHLLEQRQ